MTDKKRVAENERLGQAYYKAGRNSMLKEMVSYLNNRKRILKELAEKYSDGPAGKPYLITDALYVAKYNTYESVLAHLENREPREFNRQRKDPTR